MTIRFSVFVFLACLTALAGQTVARDSRLEQGWTAYRNERFGFSLRYPGDLFELEKASEAGDGQVFVARGGEARLLVGALPNDKGQTPAAYQDYIAQQSYAGYQIGYRRLAGNCSGLRSHRRGNRGLVPTGQGMRWPRCRSTANEPSSAP
jgi:hypothetical protein